MDIRKVKSSLLTKTSTIVEIRFGCTFVLLICAISIISGQIFQADAGGIITDFDQRPSTEFFPLDVELSEESLNQHFGLERVCFEIKHKRSQDLKIELLSPQGTIVWLSNRNEDSAKYGYFNTCVSEYGLDGPIQNGGRLFEGEFIPEGRLDFFNDGQNPNGTWYLLVTDLESGVIGKLASWKIEFSDNPAFLKKKDCSSTSIVSCYSSTSEGDLAVFLPDLILSPEITQSNFEYFSSSSENKEYRKKLKLASAMANIGEGPLEIVGNNKWLCGGELVNESDTCRDGRLPRQRTLQNIYARNKNNEVIVLDKEGGSLYFDDTPGHNHYHAEDWVTFSLLKKRWWVKDPKKWKKLGISNKISYCLFDNMTCLTNNALCNSNEKIHHSGNLENFGFGQFRTCNSTKQGISVGCLDYYGKFYEGQEIELEQDPKPGIYYLHLEVDPANHYRELDEENNTLLIAVEFYLDIKGDTKVRLL